MERVVGQRQLQIDFLNKIIEQDEEAGRAVAGDGSDDALRIYFAHTLIINYKDIALVVGGHSLRGS